MSHIRYRQYRVPLPRSPWVRIGLGLLFVLGGLVSILPIFGLWMLPVGVVLLSYDIPFVRRWRRRSEVTGLRWWKRHRDDPTLSRLRRWSIAAWAWPFAAIHTAKTWTRRRLHQIPWYRAGRAEFRRSRRRRKRGQMVESHSV